MEDYPYNSFNEQVRRVANLRGYDKPLDNIRHEIKLNGDTDYLRLIVVAADMFNQWMETDVMVRTEPMSPVSGEIDTATCEHCSCTTVRGGGWNCCICGQ